MCIFLWEITGGCVPSKDTINQERGQYEIQEIKDPTQKQGKRISRIAIKGNHTRIIVSQADWRMIANSKKNIAEKK